MNLQILKEAEKRFLKKYPGGFTHPEMQAVGKKHKMDQLEAFAKESFAKVSFDNPEQVIDSVIKLMSRSTLVSMFEKPKFRDMVRSLNRKEKNEMCEVLNQLLHGKMQSGFEKWVEILHQHRLAKWPLATAILAYYSPRKEVFIKPTTTKLILDQLEIDLIYKPTPTWDFYRKYRQVIQRLKKQVDHRLSPNNAAFCGFLMTSLKS